MKWYSKNTREMIFPGMIAFFVVIMIMVSPITIVQGIKFWGYQIFCILIPGRTLLYLLRINDINYIEEIAWGYGLGYVLNIIQYLLLGLCGGLKYYTMVQGVIAILAVMYFVCMINKQKGTVVEGQAADVKQWLTIGVFWLGIVCIRFVTYYGRNLLPTINQNVTFPVQDILFYIGNAISATKGFPVEEFRYMGEIFFYHYFGSVQLGVMSLVTGIDALSLEYCLAWIQPLLILVPSFWCLLMRMGITYRKRLLGMVVLFFTAGLELLVYVAYQHIMYVSSFGWDVGLAFGILTLTFMYMQYNRRQFDRGVWMATLLALFGCIGSKAPLAVVIMSVLGGICVIWLFRAGKSRYWALGYGVSLIAVFVGVFFGVVSNGFNTITTNASGLKLSFTGHLYECGLGKMYFDWVGQGMPQVLGKVFIMVLFFFGCNLVAYYLFATQVIRLVGKGIHKLVSFEGCLVVGVCCGFLLTLFTKQSGNSQMYFAMSAFPLAVLFALKIWEEMPVRNSLYKVGCAVCLVVSMLSFVSILNPSIGDGVDKLAGESDFSQESNSLTYEEWQAYCWVRDNTDKNAVCVTNAVIADEQYQNFIVGVCTERQMYMEGWRYVVGVMDEGTVMQRRKEVCAFYEGDVTAKNELLNAGVEYVIWTQRYGVMPEEEGFFGEKVYDDECVKIYRLEQI